MKKALGAPVKGQLIAKTREVANIAGTLPIFSRHTENMIPRKTTSPNSTSETSNAASIRSLGENSRLFTMRCTSSKGWSSIGVNGTTRTLRAIPRAVTMTLCHNKLPLTIG
jgi:hypothetical protein